MKEELKLPHYIGGKHPNCDYHHGQIKPARGVKCYQVARANTNAKQDDGTGYTYKHAADIGYFFNRYYIQYLCNPVDEHVGEGKSILACSMDGIHWDNFQVSFPAYLIKSGIVSDYKGNTHYFDGESYAYMHQRMSFFTSTKGTVLVLGFYGWSPDKCTTNWDNYGIGRVVREIYPDGSLSPIYFIRVNWQGGWSEEDLNYPLYNKSEDDNFKDACRELLNNSLYVQQWAEENGDHDDIIKIKHPPDSTNQAFCWYHIDENTIIGLWKHSKVARSDDNGVTWSKVEKSPSLVMSGQKVWGCKTRDGRFAMVYTPTLETQHRYPLCITTSHDGIAFDNMHLVHGEVPPMRYKGFWKDLGPQYMRGISEGLDEPNENALWMTYSVNKEDIWVARIPVPVMSGDEHLINDTFESDKELDNWNFYVPKWAEIKRVHLMQPCLVIENHEPYDYCVAERQFAANQSKKIHLEMLASQIDERGVYLELQNDQGQVGIRIVLRDNGLIYVRTVTEIGLTEYVMGERISIELEYCCKTFSYSIKVNGSAPKSYSFMRAVNHLSRFVIRTGPMRRQDMLDICPDDKPEAPLPDSEVPVTGSCIKLYKLIIED